MYKRLSKLFNMSTTTTSTPKPFPLFPDLPYELQTLIWHHAVDPYRILRITLYQKDFPPTAEFLGSSLYGPPWHVKAGCTPALKKAARHVCNLMLVSRSVYQDIMRYILPDRIHVTVDWDPPYYTREAKLTKRGKKVYAIPWNRKTERICLEIVHLDCEEEIIPRGHGGIGSAHGLPAPPVWVNQPGYEPFGQGEESDPDESRDPSRPSTFYVPLASASTITSPDPDQDPDQDPDHPAFQHKYKSDPDPKASGEIYLFHSHAQALCQRRISLAPNILNHLNTVQYESINPLLMIAKILRVTTITIIDDSILNDGPSPAWVDEHKTLDEPRMTDLGRLRAALGETQQGRQDHEGHDGTGTGTGTASTSTPDQLLARQLRLMNLTPHDLFKIQFFRLRLRLRVRRVRAPPTPSAITQDGRRNAREAQRVGGARGDDDDDEARGPDGLTCSRSRRRDGQYGACGFGSTRGWWGSGSGSGPGSGPFGGGVGYDTSTPRGRGCLDNEGR
ncbi:hypothetical protein QBC45DRAFT_452735 [Copromyces sp. CBS 386.78]|nr:hypothetical protein QBC45DRAFT_452735 [Copromyces sp. CBS 386.78]